MFILVGHKPGIYRCSLVAVLLHKGRAHTLSFHPRHASGLPNSSLISKEK